MLSRAARREIATHLRLLFGRWQEASGRRLDVLVRSQDALVRFLPDGGAFRAIPRRGRPVPCDAFGTEDFLFLALRHRAAALHPTAPGPHPTAAAPHPTAPGPHPTAAAPHPTAAGPHPAAPHPTAPGPPVSAVPPLAADAIGSAFDPSPPAVLRVAGDCGQTCIFCRDRVRRAPLRFWRRPANPTAALEALPPGRRRLLIEGLDPLAWGGVVECVAAACRRGYEDIAILTPGARLGDGQIADALVAAGLDRVEVALYGATAARHDAVTRTPGSFVRLCRGLEVLTQAGVLVVVHTAMVGTVLADLGAIARLARGAGWSFERIEGLVADPGQESRYARLAPDLAALRRAFEGALPELPEPIEIVDLPACAASLPGLSHRWTPRPGRATHRYGEECEGCRWRADCQGYSLHHDGHEGV
jgi:hypothetical protein